MIPKEILKKIRRIEITTSRMVTDVFAGQYKSVFKGRGMEFDEVREYLPGDEIRAIDWNVTARMGHPFIKQFVEERELTIMLLIDKSPSSYFGTTNELKSQLAAEVASLLAFSAIKNNDKVGLIIFTDKVEKFIPPRKGSRHVLRVIREALYYKPDGKGTDIEGAVSFLNRVTKRKTVSFVISDFYASNFRKSLLVANKRHDLIAVTITDPRELEMPNVDIVELKDPETNEEFLIDTSSHAVRNQYARNAKRLFSEREKLFRSIGVDMVDIRTDSPYSKTLYRFFRMRERRFR
ncbi:MAG: DUF58 domain-containing protein [Candidatus Omnitrophica bacterium]|nr:DUF58 domain-containing protein [Candidatus Omnitrophota bacterium]